jgi:hypothetical protein
MVCHYDLIVPFRAGLAPYISQVAGRSQGQFPHATHMNILTINLSSRIASVKRIIQYNPMEKSHSPMPPPRPEAKKE